MTPISVKFIIKTNVGKGAKKLFLSYVGAWHEVNSEANLDSFIMGFRLGAAFAWILFALSFGICFAVSLCVTLSRQKRENEAMAAALERLKME